MQKLTRISWTVIAYLLIVYGIVLRICMFAQNRNFIIDEANIARNVYERNFIGLTKFLDYQQYAPIPFLWICKCSTLLFGVSDYSLRLPALLAGIMTLILFARVCLKYVPPLASIYGIACFAVAFIFLEYSTSVKQYMFDALCTCGLIGVALPVFFSKHYNRKSLLSLLIVGSIIIWVSMPAMITLLSVLLALLYLSICGHITTKTLLCFGLIWGLQITVNYFIFLKPIIGLGNLQQHHQSYFFNFSSSGTIVNNLKLASQFIKPVFGYFRFGYVVGILLMFLGIYHLFRTSKATLVFLVSPLIITVILSSMRQYSLMERLLLFLYPLLLLIATFGVQAIFQLISKSKNRSIAYAIVAFACLKSIYLHQPLITFTHPYRFHQICGTLQYMLANNIPGNQVMIHCAADPNIIYYMQINNKGKHWQSISNVVHTNWGMEYTRQFLLDKGCKYLLISGGISSQQMDALCNSLNARYIYYTKFDRLLLLNN
jgi:Dolichyl-phosphate-mannose-protein mannosyltransferase